VEAEAVAYSEDLAQRIRDAIDGRPGVRERKMFGGIAWMVNGNMACGIIGEDLMVRLDRADAEAAMAESHVGPVEFTGRPMGGFVVVEAAGVEDGSKLERWIDAGAAFAESLPAK
jgi:TfoX/Sxy family transcriptional regulator of competence genes